MDHRDRLILALSALIRAEREARHAWDAAIAADAISPDLAAAIGNDPARFVSQDDIELAEAFVSPASSRQRLRASA